MVGHIIVDDIDKRGLIKFRLINFILDNDQLKREFVNLVFINIKELYHKHTHHDGDTSVADRLLPVCFTDNRIVGMAGILTQFQKKIIFYNLLIKENFIFNNKKSLFWNPMNSVHEAIRQATGEFLYALNFINFYKNDIEDVDVYETVFRNEISSINAYSEEAESQYGLWLTQKITILTWLLVGLTVLLVVISTICGYKQDVVLNEILKAINALCTCKYQ